MRPRLPSNSKFYVLELVELAPLEIRIFPSRKDYYKQMNKGKSSVEICLIFPFLIQLTYKELYPTKI